MKATELIKKLQEMVEEHGDKDVMCMLSIDRKNDIYIRRFVLGVENLHDCITLND